MYSPMLESHNDTAAAIAEHVAGTREAFADMMNQKARDIGCRDTFFITPNGLDAEDPDTGRIHSTTAAELAGILGTVCSSLRSGRGFTGDPGAVPRLFRRLRDQDLFLRQS